MTKKRTQTEADVVQIDVKRMSLILSVIVTIGLMIFSLATVFADVDALKEKSNKQEASLEQYRSDVSAMRQDIAVIKAQNTELTNKVTRLEQKVDQLQATQ